MTEGSTPVSDADAHYRYRSEDRSLVLKWLTDPVLLPMVRRLPRRMTPNQLTLLGHVLVAASALVALSDAWSTQATLLALAVGYSAFNLADTLDGMYARHSGRTSSRGELLDHGLDPVSLGLVVLTYGRIMGVPAWLTLVSTATVAFVQFVTFLHGYRIGFVILGEIGVIEGLGVAAGLCLLGAAGGQGWLTAELFAGVPVAGALACAFVLGALPALISMRGLVAHLRDLGPILLLDTAIAIWFIGGRLDLAQTALMLIAAGAYQSMAVTAARLRRRSLRLFEPAIVGTVAAAFVSAVVLVPTPDRQRFLAWAVILCLALRTAVLFAQALNATSPRIDGKHRTDSV